ncbi:MAG: MerR family transcriptional regulator [Rickettsiales bacterium]|nr:MerR family transcriptional regulator [Rickettsiales bacterium]
MSKAERAFRTISEVSRELDVPQHVLRFWESKFTQISPLKRSGGRRYYRPEDIRLLKRIRDLLYVDGFTIKGVQKLIREQGVKSILNSAPSAIVASVKAETGAPKKPQSSAKERQAIILAIAELMRIKNLLEPVE